jgi:hypothetical protein
MLFTLVALVLINRYSPPHSNIRYFIANQPKSAQPKEQKIFRNSWRISKPQAGQLQAGESTGRLGYRYGRLGYLASLRVSSKK